MRVATNASAARASWRPGDHVSGDDGGGVGVTGMIGSAGAAPSGVASLESQGTRAEASAAPSASLDPEAAQLAFAQCMRDHGIDMPDPETAPGGGFNQRVEVNKDDAEEMQAAQQACDHFLDQAGGPRGELDPAQLDKLVEFAQCMREHGVDMPDPTRGACHHGALSVEVNFIQMDFLRVVRAFVPFIRTNPKPAQRAEQSN